MGTEERYPEWSFTETLSLDDVEIRERQQVDEDGELCIVSYAHAIQGRETTKITYKMIRKVCTYLGVRYYKNQPKNVMLEIIAQKKLKGQVPESYRKKRKVAERARPVYTYRDENRNENRDPTEESHPPATNSKRQRVEADESNVSTVSVTTTTNSATTTSFHLLEHRNENNENRDSTEETTEEASLSINTNRQRVETGEANAATIPVITTTSSATNAFLQPLILAETDQRQLPADNGPGIPTTPSVPEPPRIYVEMSLTDRVDTFNLLRHIRQQIQHVEDEIATQTTNSTSQMSTIKTQRLTEDLRFYLAERRSLIQQLENSRYM
ncbi:hypothetical protein AM587_10007328 [Phytophthora nicotianae]|uniref:Uncharacterized protein n=2 Tax=Phytophthora nicotianae TaxID=4792 RepID=A0A0W8DYW8_PHYNI|nr:hypothetical protein AM587_10007328 [Phytophthora nicotianae]